MNKAQHITEILKHLQALQDDNLDTDSDGDSYIVDNKLRLKLNSITDRVRSLL